MDAAVSAGLKRPLGLHGGVTDHYVAAVAKIVHVLVAATWMGYAISMNVFIAPKLRKLPPNIAGPVMGTLGPAGLKAGNILGGLTLLTGPLVLYLQAGALDFSGGRGRLLLAALLINLTALLLLNYAIRPTMKRLGELAKESRPGEPPSLLMMVLQKRLAINGAMMLLLIVSVAVMMVLVDQGITG